MSNMPALTYTIPDTQILADTLNEYSNQQIYVNWQPRLAKNKWLKVPVQPMNKPDQHLSLTHALNANLPVGLVLSQSHSLLAMDIDGVNPSHPSASNLRAFIQSHPTYEEASPSGLPHRRRRIYALLNKADKSKFANQPKTQYLEQHAELALYVNSGFVTLTGQETNNQPISIISTEDILSIWPEFKKKDKEPTPLNAVKGGVWSTASLVDADLWVREVPCDRDHPRVIDLCAQEGWNYYDYWLTGLMALHFTFGPSAGFMHAQAWSEKDPAYESYDAKDLTQTWDSISNMTSTPVTEKTYQWFFDKFNIEWPVRNMKGGPIHAEISNFKALLDHYRLSIKVDGLTQEIFVTGPESTICPTFYANIAQSYSPYAASLDRLATVFTDLTRRHKFRPTYNEVKGFIKFYASIEFPTDQTIRFADYIANIPAPKEDYITMIARDILQRDPTYYEPSQEFHILLVRKWLLSLGRTLWPNPWRYQTAEGMLIISGQKGGIGKSTFPRKLFPKDWSHLQITTKPRLSGQLQDKDYKMKTCTRLIVDFDEGERIINHNAEADLKSEITAAQDSFRVPYGTEVQVYPRRYSIMTTTNESALTIPRRGARRYWWINVKNVDLDTLDEWDMTKLWAQIRHEILTTPTDSPAPWLLTAAERTYLEGYLKPHRSENRWELALNETFDFSEEGYRQKVEQIDTNMFETDTNNPLCKVCTMGLKDLATLLNEQAGTPALKRAINTLVNTYAPELVIAARTEIINGVVDFRGQRRYLLPVFRNPF